MLKFRFRQFQIYRDTIDFRRTVKTLSRRFPSDERFVLTAQLWRALDSIVLNIAEGSDRSTDKDFAHFLNNAHTSLNEVVACLDVALSDEYISADEHRAGLEQAEKLADQLTAFRKRLIENPHK